VLGLGERAGNAPLEQVAVAGKLRLEDDLGVELWRLRELCRAVSAASGRAVPVQQPIVGENVFQHESGVHVRAMLRDDRSYEPFSPSLVGAAGRRFVIGKHSGAAAVQQALSSLGIAADRDRVARSLPLIRREAAACREGLSAERVRELHEQACLG